MEGFSIDDVRDSFHEDIGAFLDRIDVAAQAVLATQSAGEVRGLQVFDGLSVFECVEQAGHTIYGSSSLVQVQSLAQSAQVVETLARVARSCDLSGDYGQLLALAVFWTESTAAMRWMLDLELDHNSAQARYLALELRRRAARWDGSLPPLPEPDSSVAEPSPATPETGTEAGPTSVPPIEARPAEFGFEAPAAPPVPAPAPALASAVVPPAEAGKMPALPTEAGKMPALPDEQPAAALAKTGESRLPATGTEAGPTTATEAGPTADMETGPDTEPAEQPTDAGAEFNFDMSVSTLQALQGPGPASKPEAVEDAGRTPASTGTEAGPASAPVPAPAQPISGVQAIPGLADELLEIFQQEARESLVALQGYLQTLAGNPADMDTLQRLERIYHTLKGASATVGLAEVSSMASAMEQAIENARDAGATVTPEFISGLVERTNKLLAASGLPAVAMVGRAALPAGLSSELRQIFFQEATALFRQMEVGSHALTGSQDDPAQYAEAVHELRDIAHKLKGSAAINARADLIGEAERLEALCVPQTEAGTLQQEFDASLERMRALLAGESGVSEVGPASVPVEADAAKRDSPASATGAPAHAAVREEVYLEADGELKSAFESECAELLETIDKCLFALEDSAQPKELINHLFRAYHTLKGSVNTVGLSPIGRLVHRVEDYLEELINASILPSMRNLTSLLLKVQDGLRRNLKQALQGYVETSLAQLDADIARVRAGRTLRDSGESGAVRASGTGSGAESGRERKAASSVTKPGASGRVPESGAPLDMAEHARKSIRVSTDRLDALMNLTGEMVVSRARMARRVQMLRGLQRELNLSRKRLLVTVDSFRERYEFSTARSRRVQTMNLSPQVGGGAGVPARRGTRILSRAQPGATRTTDSTPAAEKLFTDLELDRYDEVNILARSLNEISSDIAELQAQISATLDSFTEDSDAFSTNVAGLQNEITGARMVPVDQLFARLRRPARDAAERENKDVRVLTSGEEVDLDKTIIDELYLPMLHLVRNAVAHGIEPAEARQAAGKDSVGTITLSARQESGLIVLEVSDDGGGLNLKALYEKGVNRGLVPVGAPLEASTIQELIFVSGISTSKAVGDVSGRGLGCDVVRREIERLDGQVNVSSISGSGTTFTITLPLTLAIRRALMVRQHGQLYAIPLNFAQKSVDLASSELLESAGVQRININGAWLPLHGMEELFQLPARNASAANPADGVTAAQHAILLTVGERRAAVSVDEVLGQEEIVVKGLGDILTGHPLFSGVTISGDGELIMIVDVPGLLESVESREPLAAGRDAGLARELAARPASEREREERPAESEGGKLRVLFVDDSLSVRKVAEKFLKNLGVQVTLAVDGVDGMEKLRQATFDLVFTDLEMPRMHGYELIRELRFVPAFKGIPIVVVTSRSGEKHRAQAELVGASDYVTKPFTQEILAQKLQQWTGRKVVPVPG